MRRSTREGQENANQEQQMEKLGWEEHAWERKGRSERRVKMDRFNKSNQE